MASIWVWIITAAAIAGILSRHREWPEAVWACAGAALLILFRLIPLSVAGSAVAKGTDVYLFLTGMMLLADLARHEGVFDWAAEIAVRASKGSRTRLFGLVYCVGILVTVFLSNDATAVVLTPAVYVAMKRAQADARPYLFACAFIANAASFVLPISNPANLVVYGKDLPPLVPWLKAFALPSLVSIAITFGALRWLFRKELRGGVAETAVGPLSASGRRAVWGVGITGTVLILASAFGRDLGLPTAVAAILSVLFSTRAVRRIMLEVSWSVLPLVAGLFVLVEAMQRAGGSQAVEGALGYLARLPPWQGMLGASFGVAALSNLVNNLPSGLLVGSAHIAPALRAAVLIGVDLGPNLSVTGSLATVLWLIALRREGERVSAWTFLKYGVVTMTPALLLSTLSLVIPAHAAEPIAVMLLDGESAGTYHNWRLTTPVLKKELEETGLFRVDVVTVPARPDFARYQVVVSNLDSPDWPADWKSSFEQYVKNGGGLVIVHAADNAFANWKEYNEMIGVGGWRDRDEKAGPHWFWRDGKMESDTTPGKAGGHGARLPFQVAIRDTNHPITRGLPATWMHQGDELYNSLRGPGEHMTVLATAFSDPANKGTGKDEPMLMVLSYGKGRIFHTTMGHDVSALSCVGFMTTFQRGTEWAATGKVTQKVPANFPTSNSVSYRTDIAAMDPANRPK